MSLSDRINARLCKVEGCRRERVYPDQPTCADHRVKWMPEWRRHLTAVDRTGLVKAA
jgi:hypothetical protein